MPIRALARKHAIAVGTAHTRLAAEMDSLPTNEWLSQIYCNQWGGVLNLDGVYLHVKGYDRAIPAIYGIDFETHDIPSGILAPSENEDAFVKFFSLLKAAHYPLRLVICDDAAAIKPALARKFPDARIQLCHVHILRNIRTTVGITKEKTAHLPFFLSIRHLLGHTDTSVARNYYLMLLSRYCGVLLYRDILLDLALKWDYLFAYLEFVARGIPCSHTNNLIEAYNSHLKGRVKSIKGFESFASAERWLNAWILRRRFKPFSACGEPFKHLNGHCSFEMSKRKNAPWPKVFGIQAPETER